MSKKFKKKFLQAPLLIFDFKSSIKGDVSFGINLIRLGIKVFIVSLSLLLLLFLLDFSALHIFNFLYSTSNETLTCKTANLLLKIDNVLGIRVIEFFKDVITIGAGILGVLLGLFYTSFLTIIATRYSNINSAIRVQLLNNKSLNKYFIFLASIISVAIFFQLSLSMGYRPSPVSCIFFTLLTIYAIGSFIKFGKASLIYFDINILVDSIIKESYVALNKIRLFSKNINKLNIGRTYLYKIYTDIETIKLIIKESVNHQSSKNSLNFVSRYLLNFSTYYSALKYHIPSTEGWHIQITKFKQWENAREWDFSLLKTTGVDIIPETVDSYNEIEKNIITAQFKLFDLYINSSENTSSLSEQSKFLQTISIQCEFQIFEHFFEQLKIFSLKKLKDDADNKIFNIQLIEIFNYLIINYLVGFNLNLTIFEPEKIKLLAKAIHDFENTNNIISMPYYLRIWIDSYQKKLENEKFIEHKIVTPLFFTEFELSWKIQNELQNHWKKLISYCEGKILAYADSLVKNNLNVESLQLNIGLLELQRKVQLFIENTSQKINELNALNFQKKESFLFKDKDELLKKNTAFRAKVIENIWEVGYSAYHLKENELPDIFGTFYNVILDDITDKILDPNSDEQIISKNLTHFFVFCLLYIESMRVKYKNEENIKKFASKIIPLVIDLFEISSLSILVAKALNKTLLIDSIFTFWDKWIKKTEDELVFWKSIYPFYEYSKSSFMSLSNNSYIKSQERERKLADFLIKNGIARQERSTKSLFKSYFLIYKTDSEDYFIRTIVENIDDTTINYIDISEIFVEFYLRGRINLKELNIKETRYGEQLERIVGTKIV